jgi:Phosphotransferase enzyme family
VVEELVFGTRDGGAIDERVNLLCVAQLGSPVADVRFRTASVGVVFGLRLADGRQVVLKAHQPRESREKLEAVHAVQGALFRAGFPCPEPLAGPAVLADGFATVESLVDVGEFRDTHDPTYSRLMAEALAWHLDLARACGRPAALAAPSSVYASDELWPEAHSPVFDFAATAAGAEWIDAIAVRAKALAAKPGELLVGHHDWSGKHFRFGGERVTAVYDWDSLRLNGEAVIVGNAAMTFTTNFDMPGLKLTPTPDELRAFVDEYSTARDAPLSRSEREQIAACATYTAAYSARCEHARRDGYDGANDANSFTTALREHGVEYLAA